MSWKEATWEEAEGEIMATFGYIATSLSTVYSGDFSQFVANYYDFKSLWDDSGWLKEQISVDSNDNSITFSEDLTAYMKQALIEYAEETNGFTLIPTTNINDLSASDFRSGYVYHSFRNLVHEAGVICATGGGVGGNICDQSLSFSFSLPFDSDTVKSTQSPGPVSFVKASNYNSPYFSKVWFYDSLSWESLTYKTFDCKVYYNTEDGHTAYKVITSLDECPVKTGGQVSDLSNSYGYIGWNPKINFSKNFSGFFLYSTDGRKLRVFNSLNALKNYTAGQRGVYFGSGFYDDIGEIKVSFDDLEKYINTDSDKLFDKLKDLIGENEGNLTEEDLEKLVDKILNASDGSGGSGSGPGSDSTPSSIIGWLEKIYDKLADMLQQLKSIKRWTVIDTVINGVDAVADWLDLIHDIISDADDGMESAVSTLSSALDDSAGLLKKKFPFSVPWDILAFVTLFAAEPEVPRFEVPIDIGVSAVGLDIHYDFVVDFSDYQYLSDIFRAVLSLTYAVGLIKMTAGIASTKKEE